MLKSHQNMLTPRLSDRLRIGDFVVDLSLREVASADADVEPTRITVKAQGVLMALVAHAGKVVSREALMDWVWPDTMPNEDVLTQGITQLRKAFGDSRKQNDYIETISKHGYRLIAPVEWMTPEPFADGASNQTRTGEPAAVEPIAEEGQCANPPTTVSSLQDDESRATMSPANWKRLGLIAAAFAVLLAVFLLLGPDRFQFQPTNGKAAGSSSLTSATTLPFQRIVSSPALEYAPSLSSDGSLLVFVRFSADESGSSLFLQTASPLSPKPLTEAQTGRWDAMPAWSPDGRQIAFVRRIDSRCKIMLIPVTGGSEREIGDCLGSSAIPLAWSADGEMLIAAGQPALEMDRISADSSRNTGSALFRMRLDTGRWEPIVYERSPADMDESPSVSPNGVWIAFHRNAALGDIWRMPIAGGVPQRLTRLQTNVYGLAWTPDNSGIVFSRYQAGIKVLSKLDIATGRISDFSLGSGNFEYPSTSRDSGAIAFQIEDARASMRRLALGNGRSAYEKAETLYETTLSNRLPSISPDGSQIVFLSDRTGRQQIWWADRSQITSLRPIEGLIPSPRFPAAWNAASDRMLAVGEGADGKGVYEIEPRHGRVARLPVPEANPTYAAYHSDPDRLLVVAAQEDGRLGLTLYDRSSRPWRALARVDEDIGVAVVDDANKRILFVLRSRPEIWSADMSLQNRVLVETLGSRGGGRLKTFAATPDGVWFLDRQPGCAWYWRPVARDASDSRPQTAGTCLGDPGAVDIHGTGYDPVRRELYLSTMEYTVQDIGLLPVSESQTAAAKR